MRPQASYWNNCGKFEDLGKQLQTLIPSEGAVDQPSKNPALEKFRKASNCYYDLYNNGLCNRAREFAAVFGIRTSMYKYGYGRFDGSMYVATERAMDEIVMAAAIEQGLVNYSVLCN